ncbi:uncharacterized protein [Asterias amurensis]|uniref:uncharacterized protein n=1 Tax=Asterias amurensis TaxID=7602 RepID=UPI003AB8227C
MESAVVSLFSDYKHGKRFKSQPLTSAAMTRNNTRTMPSLLRSKPRKSHSSIDAFHKVEVSQRLRCTTTPPPSLQSQSLPRISLHGNHTKQQHRHSYSNHLPAEKTDNRLFMPSIQYRATQSLPSLSQSKMSGKNSKKSLYTKDPQRCSTFDLFKTSRIGRRTASHRQNYAWDFGSKDDEVSPDMKDSCFPTLGPGDTQSTRPVHLYMSVEMMDKLLEKRKGLRSDATLNALIGLPPSTSKNSNNEKGIKDSPKTARKIVEESNVQEIRPSILKETTSKEPESEELNFEELKSEEQKTKELKSKEPKSKESKSKEPKPKVPKSKKPTSKERKSKEPNSKEPQSETMSEDFQDDEMEFEDDEEAELGGLGEEEDGDEEFDAAEDEEEDDADLEEDADDEEEFDEISNDSDEELNEDFLGQGGEGEEMPDAEDMEGDCEDEEEHVGEELDEQDNDNSDDEDLAGQDKDGGTEEEEGESDQEDEPIDEEGGHLSDEDEQNEASEDDVELSDDDEDE